MQRKLILEELEMSDIKINDGADLEPEYLERAAELEKETQKNIEDLTKKAKEAGALEKKDEEKLELENSNGEFGANYKEADSHQKEIEKTLHAGEKVGKGLPQKEFIKSPVEAVESVKSLGNNKLILEEVEAAPSEEEISVSDLISSMIRGEWDAIDLYNRVVAELEYRGGYEHIIDQLREISGEEFIHVGQLEKLMTKVDANSEKIEDGRNHEELEGHNEEPIK